MKTRKVGSWVAVLILGLVLAAPRASAQTTWTNVSASEVITEVWSDDANWSAGKPGAEIAFLTNTVNSYVVNYNTTDTGFRGGTLRMANSSPHTVTLNINAIMGLNSSGSWVTLGLFNANSAININNGGTWIMYYRYGDIYGNLVVHDGGTVNLTFVNANTVRRMKMQVASGGVFNGHDYMMSGGGNLTVEAGGVFSGRDPTFGDRHAAGTAAVTNRGSFATSRDLKLAAAMQYSDRDAFLSMEGGVMRIGTDGGDYGLVISRPSWGNWGGTWAGRGEFLQSGGVVTNNILQVGCSVLVGTSSDARSANGFLTLEDGSFWNTQHALIGGFPTTIAAGSVDNAANNLRGTVTQSGGAFRSLGPVYLANGPSTGTLNLSGGTFTVSNGGNATLFVGANEGANVTLIGEGTVNLTGGHLAVDHLVANKGVDNSILNFSSGTLEIRETADVGAGTDVTVGDGVDAARLVLGGGVGTEHLILDGGSDPETVFNSDSSSRINVAEDAVFQQNFGAMTLEFWFKPTQMDAWNIMVHRHDVGGANVGSALWFAGLQDGSLIVTFNARHAESAWDDGKTSFQPTLGTWYHVAGVWDGSQGHVYVDGELIHTYDSNPMTGNGAGAMAFGAQVAGDRPYHGLLSDVRLWDQTRSAAQITDNRYQRLNGNEAGLIGYWPLNEGTGTTAGDLVSSNNGTLTTSAGWVTPITGFTFVDGVTINTNALLDIGGTNAIGTATITGNVTLHEDARLAWDFNASSQDVLTVTGSVDLPDSVTVELNSLDGSTPDVIPLMTVTGTISGSPASWPRSEIDGQLYRADVTDGTLQMLLVPAGTFILIR